MILALAGLSELSRMQSLLLIGWVILSFFFIPISVHKTVSQIGVIDYYQVPIIALTLLLAWSVSRGKGIRVILPRLILTYIVVNALTNFMALMNR
jgi:hypothetical protein